MAMLKVMISHDQWKIVFNIFMAVANIWKNSSIGDDRSSF